MTQYDHDLIVIGLGPAGMAVSIMASEMGLNVCAIEKHKIGGECMNVGCIPSKALLRMGKTRHVFEQLPDFELGGSSSPEVLKPFEKIERDIRYINEKKTMGMFKKVNLILDEGGAEFVDAHTVRAGERTVTAKRIFIATGTQPMVPPIPGLAEIDILTNNNMFSLDRVPESMVILGGGAIGCEMAQAFRNLGCKCTVIHMDKHLVPVGDPEAGKLLEEVFNKEGIEVLNERKVARVEKTEKGVRVFTDQDESFEAERILVAAGRKIDLSPLKLENAGVTTGARGAIHVNKYLQTAQPHIYAVGDCNGHYMLSHAAMHQGMIALMNSMAPWPFKQNFKKFVVPWTVFTTPQVSYAGMREAELQARGIKYETIVTRYDDYGAAIAENVNQGYIKAFVSSMGRIYGVSIVGEGSGEMINEWALAIQKKIRMHDIMLLQHSFPTMGFLTKRSSENWMMNKMEMPWLKKLCKAMF